MKCRSCGKAIDLDAKFCNYCGAKLFTPVDIKQTNDDSSSGFWIIATIVGILGLVFWYISYLHSQGQCLVIGPRGSTSNMTCDGLENPITNFLYVIGMFLFLAFIRPIISFISSLFTNKDNKN